MAELSRAVKTRKPVELRGYDQQQFDYSKMRRLYLSQNRNKEIQNLNLKPGFDAEQRTEVAEESSEAEDNLNRTVDWQTRQKNLVARMLESKQKQGKAQKRRYRYHPDKEVKTSLQPVSLANLKHQISREVREKVMDLKPQGAPMNLRPVPKTGQIGQASSLSNVRLRDYIAAVDERMPYVKPPQSPPISAAHECSKQRTLKEQLEKKLFVYQKSRDNREFVSAPVSSILKQPEPVSIRLPNGQEIKELPPESSLKKEWREILLASRASSQESANSIADETVSAHLRRQITKDAIKHEHWFGMKAQLCEGLSQVCADLQSPQMPPSRRLQTDASLSKLQQSPSTKSMLPPILLASTPERGYRQTPPQRSIQNSNSIRQLASLESLYDDASVGSGERVRLIMHRKAHKQLSQNQKDLSAYLGRRI